MAYDLGEIGEFLKPLIEYDFKDFEILLLVNCAKEKLSVNDVMNEVEISHRSVLYRLKRLESDGLIKRKKEGYFKIVEITKKGKNKLKEMRDFWIEVLKDIDL